jgi:hypothetical protein
MAHLLNASQTAARLPYPALDARIAITKLITGGQLTK